MADVTAGGWKHEKTERSDYTRPISFLSGLVVEQIWRNGGLSSRSVFNTTLGYNGKHEERPNNDTPDYTPTAGGQSR